MDIIFDIDGTLADATHRLHFIKDPLYWDTSRTPPRPNWPAFLADDLVAKDAAMPATWETLTSLLRNQNRILFITGRPERTRLMTWSWLLDTGCSDRWWAADYWSQGKSPALYMRKDDDRRPSHEVKQDLLEAARMDGFDPKMVFEDRKDDTAMWRRNGLLCCQVAEGDY